MVYIKRSGSLRTRLINFMLKIHTYNLITWHMKQVCAICFQFDSISGTMIALFINSAWVCKQTIIIDANSGRSWAPDLLIIQ